MVIEKGILEKSVLTHWRCQNNTPMIHHHAPWLCSSLSKARRTYRRHELVEKICRVMTVVPIIGPVTASGHRVGGRLIHHCVWPQLQVWHNAVGAVGPLPPLAHLQQPPTAGYHPMAGNKREGYDLFVIRHGERRSTSHAEEHSIATA